jgi:hypothetical protein
MLLIKMIAKKPITVFDKNFDLSGVLKIDAKDLLKKLEGEPQITTLISPANSLGYMDGGIEYVYMDNIPDVQEMVFKGLKTLGLSDSKTRMPPWTDSFRYHLPVGYSMGFFATDKLFFISAPTMYHPCNVSNTQNAYKAMLSAIVLLKKGPKGLIDRVYSSLMCTGVGKMAPETSLEQMLKGIEDSTAALNNFEVKRIDEFYYSIPTTC